MTKNIMHAKKSLGQHFLRCGWVTAEMIKAAEISDQDIVIEVGPGTGALTKSISKRAKKVIAIEKDETLAKELRENFKKEGVKNVEIIEGDILKLLSSDYSLPATHYKLVANIPYYLTSHLLKILLETKYPPHDIVLTVQKEVAERIAARSPRMNLLAIAVQAYGTPKIIRKVPSDCFWPKPAVESAIIKISGISSEFFKKNRLDKAKFFELVRLGFSQKRKVLSNPLKKLFPKKLVTDALISLGLSPQARAEELSLDDWAKLIRTLDKKSR